MHIIFGKQQADEMAQKYTVLELDTFQLGENGPVVSAYCVVETVPLEELAQLEANKHQHEHLLINYCGRAWADCLTGINQLKGKWCGELDTFYDDLSSRVKAHIKNPPDADWSPVILKPTT
jgi:hypothetical protein